MKQSELKALIKECYNEVLAEKAYSIAQQQAAGAALAAKKGKAPESGLKGASKAMEKMTTKELEKIASTKHKGLPKHVKENEEMDLPADTGKNINMGFDNNVGLATNKKVSNRISMLQSQINDLSKQLETNLKMYKAGQMSIADYKKVAAHIPGQLKQLASDLETEMVKVSKI